MATSKKELKQENKQQIGELASDMANISLSDDVREKGMLALPALRNREEMLIKYKTEVKKKVENHLQQLEEEADIFTENEGCDQIIKHIDEFKEYLLLEHKRIRKEKEHKEAIEALDRLVETTGEDEVTDEDGKSEVEKKEEIENEIVESEDCSEMEGLRRSRRKVEEPFWMKDYVKNVKGKGKK